MVVWKATCFGDRNNRHEASCFGNIWRTKSYSCSHIFNSKIYCLSTRHAAGLYWVPGHLGVRGKEIAGKLAWDGSVQKFVGPEPALGVSRQNIRRKDRCWLAHQRWARWRGLSNTQKQARELISGPCPGAKTRFLSFNRTKSKVVTGHLTGHNTLRRHFHLMRLSNCPLCRRCEAEDETSAHILCECEALTSLRHAYLGSFFGSRGY